MDNKKSKDSAEISDSEVATISLRDIPLDRRRKEASKPLFLIRYD